jgi:hypothetical protein
MNIRFYLDPATGEPHIYSHGITEDEVADFLRNPGEERPGRDKPSHPLPQWGMKPTFCRGANPWPRIRYNVL